jgi:hypothetical protein
VRKTEMRYVLVYKIAIRVKGMPDYALPLNMFGPFDTVQAAKRWHEENASDAEGALDVMFDPNATS